MDGSDKLAEVFRNRVKSELRDRNWTQTQFAAMVGMKQAYLSHLMTGRKSPNLEVIANIAEALEVDPGWLISSN